MRGDLEQGDPNFKRHLGKKILAPDDVLSKANSIFEGSEPVALDTRLELETLVLLAGRDCVGVASSVRLDALTATFVKLGPDVKEDDLEIFPWQKEE